MPKTGGVQEGAGTRTARVGRSVIASVPSSHARNRAGALPRATGRQETKP